MTASRLKHQTSGTDCWRIDTGLNRPGHTACYLLHDAGELALIDTGTSNNIPALLGTLQELGFTPTQVRWILPTHVHLDHAGGAGALLAHCDNATLATHHRGLPHLIDPQRLQKGAQAVYGEDFFARSFGELVPAPQERCMALNDGDRLTLGRHRLLFIDTPGHANHHGCFFYEPKSNLYTGDTFGLRYRELDHEGTPWLMATTTPVAFDPDLWMQSLDRMIALEPRRACLTHFGPLDDPMKWQEQLRQSIRDHAEIALQEESRGNTTGREERLTASIMEKALARLKTHNPGVDKKFARGLLEDDIRLNSQGLAVWLSRRAKTRGEPIT
ncbi:MBL fold metallo-hydrolase [Thiolapillus sp.]|uniref:MBL fold metallo-hydrolase n=1 Tax=Thiolapillus sp. TaxID=2017437 RepID=UPI003AF99EA9